MKLDEYASASELKEVIGAVLELHAHKETSLWDYSGPEPFEELFMACVTCGTHDEYPVAYPCPTVQALGYVMTDD